jgi:carbon-monoxide dehydrogenase medium subunit
MASLSINSSIEYTAPTTLESATRLLQRNPSAQILAGGHSLLAAIKLGQTAPSLLLDLANVPHLDRIEWDPEPTPGLKIGAMVTYDQVAREANIRQTFPALTEATRAIGDVQIRNWGRMGDAFAYDDLACDLLAVALALDSTFLIATPDGLQSSPAEQVIANNPAKGNPRSIITALTFPTLIDSLSAYEAFKQPANGYTLCGVAVGLQASDKGAIEHCRIAVTGTAVPAARIRPAEISLTGTLPTPEKLVSVEELVKQVVKALPKTSRQPTGHPSQDYTAHLAGIMFRRAFHRAIQAAEGGARWR